MTYQEKIADLRELTMSDIIHICRELLPHQYRKRPWDIVNHGTDLLSTEDQLNAYIAAYGEMHWTKCRVAFQNFSFDDNLTSSIEVVDWGCGQGIASISLIEMLRERDKLNLLGKVTLVEPSEAALNRAYINVDKATNHRISILPLSKYLPCNSNNPYDSIEGISYEYPIVIHLFSNILDISNIDLSKLACIVATPGRRHYIMCMGPKNTGAYRIDRFCSIFNVSELISNVDNAQYGYTSDTHHSYSCKTKCLVFENGTLSDQNIHHFVAPTLISGAPIYDDYDPRMFQLNRIGNEYIAKLNDLLGHILDEQDLIYVKPSINGDTPDIVVVRPNKGVLLINVCESTEIDDVKQAINTINTYQQNIIQVHIKDMMGKVLINPKDWSLIKMMLYFPHNTTKEIRGEYGKHFSHIRAFGNDIFDERNRTQLLEQLKFTYTNRSFDNVVFNYFVKLLSPQWHSYKQGRHITLTKAQMPLSKSVAGAQRKINGVAGSGKTQVLATRAVNAHLRTGKKVLILTFNIALVNYIKYRIGEIRADFAWDNFVISNYHQFFKTVANNHGEKLHLGAFEDVNFFELIKDKLPKYSAIFIDEVQDYKTEWLKILNRYFLETNGEFVVFGDAKQNIYKRELDENGQIRLEFIRGGWNNTLTRSMRFANTQLANIAMSFQREFYSDQPTDNIDAEQTLSFDTCIKYWSIGLTEDWQTIISNCRWIMQEYNIDAQDVVILSQYCKNVRELDYAYRQPNQYTLTTCESKEQYDTLAKKFGVQDGVSTDFRFESDIKQLRRSKRIHFTMDTNLVKLSTIHSYKGWESKTVILVLTPKIHHDFEEDIQNEPNLIYTAITRAKEKLFILNLGNQRYHSFFNTYR